jgi:hypothetical protein
MIELEPYSCWIDSSHLPIRDFLAGQGLKCERHDVGYGTGLGVIIELQLLPL